MNNQSTRATAHTAALTTGQSHPLGRTALTVALWACTVALAACDSEENSSDTTQSDTVRTVQTPRHVDEVLGIAVIEPAARISQLSAETGGLVRRIHVEVGQQVRRGQVMLELDNAVESAQLRQAGVKISTQRDAVESARQSVETLRVQWQKADADFKRNQTLFAGNALTRKDLDDSQHQVDNLSQQIRQAEAQVRQAEGQIRSLRTDVQYASTVSGLKRVKAPANGTLLSLDAKVGQYLSSNQSVGDFAPAGPLVAVTEIDELFALRVKVGQKAYVRPQGSRDRLTTGTVVLASPYLRRKSLFADNTADLEDRRVREVRVQVDDPSQVIIGARLECIINVK